MKQAAIPHAPVITKQQPGYKKRYGLIVLIALLTGAASHSVSTATAQSHAWMSAADLKATFSGATIEGAYADGRPFKESYFKTGRLSYVEQMRRRKRQGHWSIVSGTFCTIYDASSSGGCFRVRRHSTNCFEFYFKVRTELQARNPKPGRPDWTARAWRTNQPSTCREQPLV